MGRVRWTQRKIKGENTHRFSQRNTKKIPNWKTTDDLENTTSTNKGGDL